MNPKEQADKLKSALKFTEIHLKSRLSNASNPVELGVLVSTMLLAVLMILRRLPRMSDKVFHELVNKSKKTAISLHEANEEKT